MNVCYSLSDNNGDGIYDCFIVFSKNFRIPLVGDYRGIQLAIIPFSNKEGEKQAEELAKIYVEALGKYTPNENTLKCLCSVGFIKREDCPMHDEKENKTMKPFEVGEEVYDILYQETAKIEKITLDDVEVRYNSGGMGCYTKEGKVNQREKFRRLFHLGEEPVTITIPPKPKKKVKAYKWVIRVYGGRPLITSDYYRDEEKIRAMEWEPIQRIDSLFVEVEE